MKVDLKKSGPCRRTMNISVESDAVDREYEKVLSQFVKSANLPGFRKGKAPAKMVEGRYAKEIKEDVSQQLVAKFYHEAVSSEELQVVAVLDVEPGELNPGQDFEFSVSIDEDPDFKLPNYEGIKIKAQSSEPSDEDVDKALDGILDRYAAYEDVDDRSVRRDDMVKIDYQASIDGQPVAEISPENKQIGEREDFWLLVNSHAFLPEMEEGLIGCEIGSETEIQVRYDEEMPDDNLAGKTAVYKVKVKAIRGKQIPELGRDLLEQFEVESEDELRNKIRESMTESAAEREKTRQRDEICSYLLKKTKMDVPESLLAEATRGAIQNIVRRRTGQGASQDDIEKSRDEIIEEARKLAGERVKLDYILDRIADQEEIEVSDDELREHLEAEARRYGMLSEQFIASMEERSSPENMKKGVRSGKTLDILLEKANVK